jgi:ketosteroid isomerase-like protein
MFRRFPEMKLHVRRIYMNDIFAFGPSNSVAVEFDAEGTRDDGYKYLNSYVVLLRVKGGKVVEGREFAFDYEKFREAWGE